MPRERPLCQPRHDSEEVMGSTVDVCVHQMVFLIQFSSYFSVLGHRWVLERCIRHAPLALCVSPPRCEYPSHVLLLDSFTGRHYLLEAKGLCYVYLVEIGLYDGGRISWHGGDR
jgi:hypothetical protein